MRHGIDLKKVKFINCLNPAHNDKHPSMSFYEKNNTLHCFSCGAVYDTFDLIKIDNKLSSDKEMFEKAYE